MPSLQFKGKQFIANYHLGVPYCELIPRKDKSLTKTVSLHDNLILHGDNLKALKALLPTYAGKVKCIYIDPPYNTGNEGWVYNDAANSPMMKEWLGKTVDREDLTRHDKWLCMMMPRLKLLRELLREDGVIMVSINDVEHARLGELLEEIFGEENFASVFIWNNEGNIDNQSSIKTNHEYVYVFAKNKQRIESPKVIDPNIEDGSKLFNEEIQNSITKNGPKNPPSKIFLPSGFPTDFESGLIGKQTSSYPYIHSNITVKDFVTQQDAHVESGWSSKNLLELFIKNECEPITDAEGKQTWFKLTKTGAIYCYKKRSGDQHHVLTVLRNFGTTKQMSGFLEKLNIKFDYPKPTRLIQYLIEIFSNRDSIILDSFAGSGTTAHAVLALNAEDGGNRKFILVEMEDYADTITAERVRRVIKGVPTAKDENLKKGLGGSFSYFDLGREIELQGILKNGVLPSYEDLARYVFYTATGEEWNPKKMQPKKHFIGESREYEVYLYYEPDVTKLRELAFNLDMADAIGEPSEKKRLVFAPTKYLNSQQLKDRKIEFAQLPFEIYQLTK